MSNFNSIRWSLNTDLTTSNVQQIFDNDKMLYDNLVSTNNYSSDFAIAEVTNSIKTPLMQKKTFTGDTIIPSVYYGVTSVSLKLSLPPGTATLMFGCKVMLDGESGLVRGDSTVPRPPKVCGVIFGSSVPIANQPNNYRMGTPYALFNNIGSGKWVSDGTKNFYNVICGKTLYDYTNSDTVTKDVSFDVFLWSTQKSNGGIQMYAHTGDDNHRFTNQFWVMRVG